MEVDAAVLKETADYIGKTQPMLEKAAALESAVAARTPAVVDALIKAGSLDANRRESAIAALQDPLKTLETLEKLASGLTPSVSPKAPAPMGAPATFKQAGASDAGPKRSPADEAFLSKLGF